MSISWRALLGVLLLAACTASSPAVELKVTRDALERTLEKQLFSGPEGRYYVKGDAKSPCSVYIENPKLSFVQDRVVVQVKTHARLGKAFGGNCLGITLTPEASVSVAPDGEGETLGFRDARVEKVSESKELNFFLSPFLSHQIPSGMKLNAADMLRKALTDSTATSGYKVSLDRLRIHSMSIQGDAIVVDFDGDISVK